MNDHEIDEILESAAEPVDPALLSRVSSSISASLQPVRPISPQWMIVAGLLSIAAVIPIAAAGLFGTFGIHKLTGVQAGPIFFELGLFALLVAVTSVREMVPGSSMPIAPATLLILILIAWLSLDAVLFHDYDMSLFVRGGVPCLRAGLIVAAPSGLAAWLLLRRGFAVNRTAAGLAAGTFAGIAGLIMLELHCPNFRAPHVMFWHTAVVPISALAGAFISRLKWR